VLLGGCIWLIIIIIIALYQLSPAMHKWMSRVSAKWCPMVTKPRTQATQGSLCPTFASIDRAWREYLSSGILAKCPSHESLLWAKSHFRGGTCHSIWLWNFYKGTQSTNKRLIETYLQPYVLSIVYKLQLQLNKIIWQNPPSMYSMMPLEVRNCDLKLLLFFN